MQEVDTQSIPRPLVRANQWFIVISVVLALGLNQSWILVLPLINGLLGLTIYFNPIMQVAKKFLKKHPSEYINEDRAQQQFNQWISVICITLSLIGFITNNLVIGYMFAVMVGVAALVAILGFCVGCFIRFQWQQFIYRRKTSSSK
ncbi:DUF4395 domain-containing protein [Bacillus sp. HMF5848]|uniref:DUF4395 domain-containing protein n=1 Tax=Bacillus sp. HMF5848 TaxID=2495421 RepID=UPI000F782C5A|nr:DUF4395 domain-containing protein [Bacillus sp. HMF5848]RSK26611.1 DUF4395 domain-containing protein [Bacillus sp. HMF5848]